MDEIEIEGLDELVKDPVKLKETIKNLVSSSNSKIKREYEANAPKLEDHEAYKNVLAKVKELEDAAQERLKADNPAAASQVELDNLKKEYDKVIAGLNEQLGSYKTKDEEYKKEKDNVKLKDKFIETFKNDKSKMLDDFIDDQLFIFMNKFKVDEKGNIVERSGKLNEAGGAYGIDDYAKDLTTSKSKLFNIDKFGSGSVQSQNKISGWDGKPLNIFEANKLLKTNPELYRQIEKAGGLAF